MWNQHEIYNRDKLYKEVWAESVIKVAKHYGVSDVAIAKVCRKMHIPVPGRGYWSKVNSGKKLKRTPLPKYKDCPKVQRKFSKPDKIEDEEFLRLVPEALILEEKLIQKESEMKIEFDSAVRITNKYVQATKRNLKESSKDISKTYGYGRCYSNNDEAFEVSIGPNNIQRALAILQTLCNALTARRYSIDLKPNKKKQQYQYGYQQRERHPVYAIVLDAYISFKISERSIRHEIPEKDREYSYERYEYEPSGKLCFELIDSPYGNNIRSKWQDGKKTKIEDNLNDIIINMIKFATMLKEREAKAAKQREIWKIEEIKRREREKHEKIDKARVEHLIKESKRLVKFNQIKDYIEVIVAEGKQRLGDDYPDSDFSKWFEWAESFLEKNSPENWELPRFDLSEKFRFF